MTKKNILNAKKKSLSICFSCFNESFYVMKNIKKIKRILKKINIRYELLVVDDASDKVEVKKLKKFCKINKVKFIGHEHNLGFFKSFISGLINSKYEYFKLFAGDDATNTNHINFVLREFHKQELLIPYNNQFEMKGKPISRKIISIIYTKIINLMSGLNLKYYNGLPVFLKKKVLMNLADTSGYGWQAEIIVNCIYSGCSYREIYTKNREIKFTYDSIKIATIPSVIFSIIKIFFKRISPGRKKYSILKKK